MSVVSCPLSIASAGNGGGLEVSGGDSQPTSTFCRN
jgi:hypothetical protein